MPNFLGDIFNLEKLTMKLVLQRVLNAEVNINQNLTAKIGPGLCIFLGIHQDDTEKHCLKWIDKILKLRIFPDENKPINQSIADIDGEILLISQFTLFADIKGQNRPSFLKAAKPDKARELYNYFKKELLLKWPQTKFGEFGADMKISLTNDGPVTIILEDDDV